VGLLLFLFYLDDVFMKAKDGVGFPFKGLLFTGLMMTKSGPKVLEYNVRFGDPETQSVLALLETDLAELMYACCNNGLDAISLRLIPNYAVTVVIAAGGYPVSYKKGTVIKIGPLPDGMLLQAPETSLGYVAD
jgi:phosphoribosylamine--glycine ligase / phosphoribosylformylglycinamidine cyclo-ligase